MITKNGKTMTQNALDEMYKGTRMTAARLRARGFANPSASVTYMRNLGHNVRHDGIGYYIPQDKFSAARASRRK